MPKFLLLLIFSLLAPPAFAEEAKTHIAVDPKVYPPAAFKGKADSVKAMPKAGATGESIPDREQREAVFGKIPGLAQHVGAFDELDKDLLLMRSKTQPLAKLKEKYPSIPGEMLVKLQKAAKAIK